jgi:hypothetical protein
MPCASFSILDGRGGTGCDEVRFPVDAYWDDVSVVDSRCIQSDSPV